MHRIQSGEDIQPLSEFRSKVAFYFDKVKRIKLPLVIAQNGKSAEVLLNLSDYQAMIVIMEVLVDIKLAEAQIKDGLEISHQDVKKSFARGYKRENILVSISSSKR